MKRKRKVKGFVHSRYTSSGNRVRRTKRMGRRSKIAVIMIVTVLISVIFAIIVGNLLNDKSNDAIKYFNTVEPIELDGKLNLGKAPSLTARQVTIGEKPSFKKDEYSAASFFVNGEDGVFYDSAVAKYFGKTVSSGVELDKYINDLKNEGFYTVACFSSRFLTNEDASLSQAEALYEQGLIGELVSCGVDEVLVFFEGTSAQNFSRMRNFLRVVKINCEDIVLGIRLDVADLRSSDSWAEISKFSEVCDYTALDLRAVELSEDGGERAAFVASMRFYLEKYDVRILFDDENESIVDFVKRMKMYNWMIIPLLSC